MGKLADLRAKYLEAHKERVFTSVAVLDRKLKEAEITDENGKVWDAPKNDYLPFFIFVESSTDEYIKKSINVVADVIEANPRYDLQLLGNWSSKKIEQGSIVAEMLERKAGDEEISTYLLSISSKPETVDLDKMLSGIIYWYDLFDEFCERFPEETNRLLTVLDNIPEEAPRRLLKRAKPRG